jgi:cell filamentation protein
MATYSLDPIADNCYPGTTVLINKFDVRDEQGLFEIEAVLVSKKLAELEQHPIGGAFDFEHYMALHRFLFEDLYDWAGNVRVVNISKKGTSFCPAEQVIQQADSTFEYLKEQNCFSELPHSDFVRKITDFYCSTNYLHPFREGNGRAQRAFISQLIRHAGYDIDFADIDDDLLMIATIQSAHGVTDLLKEILTTAIHK